MDLDDFQQTVRMGIQKSCKQIARDLHDDIGSNLAGIVLISEVGSTSKMPVRLHDDFRNQETAEQTAEAMRILYGRPPGGTTRDLFMRMRNLLS